MKIKPAKKPVERIIIKTRNVQDMSDQANLAEWWASDKEHVGLDLCGVAAYIKTQQIYRIRQLAVNVRLYSGLSVYSYAGSNVSKFDKTKTLPDDRPTFNLIQSATDTLISRIGSAQPEPKFLTENGDYKQRHLAERLNQFILGELYQVKAYEKAVKMLRDCIVMGTGCLKVYEDHDKVCVERKMISNLYVDDNDSIHGDPQSLYELLLMDRDKLISKFPKYKAEIEEAPQAYPDNSPDGQRSTSDQVMVVEGWRLASGDDPTAKGYIPGRHTIATVGGVLFDESYHKTRFPFVFMNYSDPFHGFFGQGLATQLFGTQLSLNRILYTISRAITLMGVPTVFVENSSKAVKAHQNNEIGKIVTFTGIKPSYEVAPCNAPELYQERDKLIEYGYQQCGVSSMQATSQKPDGLDSGAAQRAYDDIASDRFATLSKRYENVFIDLTYLIADKAKEIAERTGKYETVYPNKDGTKVVDLPAMKFLNDPFVVQCFTESSLPRTPAGRLQTVTEQVQAGILTLKEGRRLMRFQDLDQNEQLDNASEERIFQILDKIVESGTYTPPDPFLDLQLALTLTTQYYNLYVAAKLEESKADMLRQFFSQCQALIMAAMPPPMPAPAPVPQANPEAPPTSPLEIAP